MHTATWADNGAQHVQRLRGREGREVREGREGREGRMDHGLEKGGEKAHLTRHLPIESVRVTPNSFH